MIDNPSNNEAPAEDDGELDYLIAIDQHEQRLSDEMDYYLEHSEDDE
jgi:hypothetical protein